VVIGSVHSWLDKALLNVLEEVVLLRLATTYELGTRLRTYAGVLVGSMYHEYHAFTAL
jgi:hypothetical protein